ncbi:DUF4394 domain-containing protein [Actinomadura decatromicini]|uniref:DUF4394 domain-containing protein n=1 Tax=Actinomadura decatromicini TaxID=2604572 RepID=A0A5D3F1V8_9ACTN|nr:DUF4394 domain-containing protein [Actinomadura decatromicini]TYK43037.1 DUF4394 domain-containing protein [Actinomadura decatromicini]
MKTRIKWGLAALAASAALVAGFPGSGSAQNARLQAFGISADGTLVAAFKTDAPQVLDWVKNPTGLVTDTSLIGIDFRVQDGKLYVVGNAGGIYTVSLDAGSESTLTKVSQLTAALKGTNFGVDFNPALDRLRVISDAGQNLRHDLNTNTTAIDSPLSANNVAAAAYTNNDLNNDTATTLFDINADTDQVVIQSPTNNGLLVATGALGVNVAPNAGLDIHSVLSNGKTVSNSAYGTFVAPNGASTFYTVDLLTGAATAVGKFPLPITDVAVALDSR